MKKTLIALVALGSVAMAAEQVTLTTGIKITSGTETQLVSALTPDYSAFDKDGLSALKVGSNFNYNGGNPKTLETFSFQVTIGALYGADVLENAGSITLNSFSYMGNANGWSEDDGRTLTVAVNGTENTKTAKLEDIRTGAWLTISDLDFNVTADDVLTITLNPKAGATSAGFTLATADIWGNGVSVAWSGIQSEKDNGLLNFNPSWGNEAPLVKMAVSYSEVPEPTTGTLSLLALAGLCARRRKK